MKNSELTVVIPAKNEAKAISNLLRSLERQTYKMYQVPIYLADADSTDGTREVAAFIASRLNLLEFKVIKGGMPAYGRNYGADIFEVRNVLNEYPSGLEFADDAGIFDPEDGAVSGVESALLASGSSAEVLAGETAADEID